MGNEWSEKHRKRRSPMDTGGRKIDPKTGKPEKGTVVQWWEMITKRKGRHQK